MARVVSMACGVLLIACMVACSGETTGKVSSGESSTGRPAKTTTEDAEVYTPLREMACATDANFLDSSPLVSPANFATVSPGTPLVMVGVGGVFAGKTYYTLSAGGSQRIHVYKHIFEQKFRSLGSLNDMIAKEKAKEEIVELGRQADAELKHEREEAARLRAANAAKRKAEKEAQDKRDRTRVWTSTSGTVIDAEFVRYSNGRVVLRKSDDSEISVAIDKLSDEDRKWIENRRH